jgi:hypothetical protein
VTAFDGRSADCEGRQAADETDEPEGARRAITRRAVVVGLAAAAANAYWVQHVEALQASMLPTAISLIMNAVFTLLLLSLLTPLVHRLAPRLALRRPELLLVYSMACLGSVGASRDFNQLLIPQMTWSFRMADPANGWDALFNRDLPSWLTIQDGEVLRGLYEGGTSFYRPAFVAAWAPALVMWTAFAGALVLVMMSLNTLMRRQWLDHEHLACPLVSLPVELSKPRKWALGNRLLWLGFGLTVALDAYNSLAMAIPALPEVPINCVDIAPSLGGRPWNAVGFFPRSFYPMVIGIGYLMPSDFLFSCWFFYLFWKAEAVIGAAFGWDEIKDFPLANYQGVGAYALFGLYGLWLARGHLRRIASAVVGRQSLLADRTEQTEYRVAALGAVAGALFLLWFSARMGMQVWLAAGFFLVYYTLALAVTRMRAQFGAPVHDLSYAEPDRILTAVIGTSPLPKQDLIGLSMYFWFTRAYRSLAMPFQMEALKMQEETRDSRRTLSLLLVLATVVGFITALWACLHYNYSLGAMAKGHIIRGHQAFDKLSAWLRAPEPTQWSAVIAMAVGAAVAFALQTMRMRYVQWPLHPLGFAVSGAWEMNVVWLPLLIAWVIKTSVTRYGGHRLYPRFRPFFLGLILGQCVVGCVASTIGLFLRIPLYKFLTMQ